MPPKLDAPKGLKVEFKFHQYQLDAISWMNAFESDVDKGTNLVSIPLIAGEYLTSKYLPLQRRVQVLWLGTMACESFVSVGWFALDKVRCEWQSEWLHRQLQIEGRCARWRRWTRENRRRYAEQWHFGSVFNLIFRCSYWINFTVAKQRGKTSRIWWKGLI